MGKAGSAAGIAVLLTGGGTGGHIYPAVAVAQELKNDPEIADIYYIGCEKNLEKDIVAREGLKFYSLNVSGMPRKLSFKFLFWVCQLAVATVRAVYYLLKLEPDVVFGTGGYVTGPVLIATKLLGKPYIIHDPDAHPGIVNRYMASGAKVVSIAFESAKKYIKNPNTKLFGNPMRSKLSAISKEQACNELGLDTGRKTVLVMGGSQGAKSINDALLDAVPVLLNEYGYQVIHQTGKKNFEAYEKAVFEKYPELKGNPAYIVRPYFDDMSIPLNAADIAISRAGSISISELNLCALPSILVPYPYAAADHQRFNARDMEKAGASVYLEDAECSSERLIALITSILNDNEKCQQMKQAAKSLAKPDAAQNILNEIKKAACLVM